MKCVELNTHTFQAGKCGSIDHRLRLLVFLNPSQPDRQKQVTQIDLGGGRAVPTVVEGRDIVLLESICSRIYFQRAPVPSGPEETR